MHSLGYELPRIYLLGTSVNWRREGPRQGGTGLIGSRPVFSGTSVTVR
jgi:hypothetical protein